jgi:hypothetical protein
MTASTRRPHRAGIAASIVGAALAACACIAQATPAGVCCADPSTFRYERLEMDAPVDFVIDSKSPSFDFQSGRSAFRAFALPVTDQPFLLEVQSFVAGPADPRRARVLYPLVAVLSEDFLVSRASDLEALSFDVPLLERTRQPAYRVALPVDPARTRERYVVVYTPGVLSTGRALPPISTPESAAAAARVAYLGASPFGRLRITLHAATRAPSLAPRPGE